MRSYSPLRYPGSKSQLAPLISKNIINNRLSDRYFVEPYAGGAGVALYLLINDIVPKIYLNDLDYRVYCFWLAVVEQNTRLCDTIENLEIDIHEWNHQKFILNKPNTEYFYTGLSAFFLNRTNHNGVIDAGPIGGLKQNGTYKIDSRFNKTNLIKKLELISKYKDRIVVSNQEAYKFIQELPEDGCFLFLDPPYVDKCAKLYFKTEDDSINLSSTLKSIDIPWLMTYSNNNNVADFYSWSNISKFDIKYSFLKNRKKDKELFIWNNFNFDLEVK